MDNRFQIEDSKWARRAVFSFGALIILTLLFWMFVPESKAKSQKVPKQVTDFAQYQPKVPEPVESPKQQEEKAAVMSSKIIESRRSAPIAVFHSSYKPDDDISSQQVQFVQARARKLDDQKYTIIQGKVITAILETAINSDIAGMTRAVVKEDIYAEKGHAVLIPKGSRLVGFYYSDIELGQKRVYVGWKRVIRPDGIDIDLDSPGTDRLGRAGLTGHVNAKFIERFSGAALMSILSAGAATLNVGKDDDYNSLSSYREGVSNAFAESASETLNQTRDLGPTIQIHQGEVIKVMVAKDLNFSEVFNAG